SGGGRNSNLYDKFNSYLVKNEFEELMSIYSDGSKISINTKTKGDRIKSVMLGITDDEDQVFVDLKSDINLDELNQLIEHYESTQQDKKEKEEDPSEQS